MISIALQCDNPKQYTEIMKPQGGTGFTDVCSFIVACVEAGKVIFTQIAVLISVFRTDCKLHGCENTWCGYCICSKFI